MSISFFIAFFAWGIPQLLLAFLGLWLLLLKMPNTLLKCYNDIIILLLLSIPPLVIGFLKDYNPVEVIQASSGFSLFFIIPVACILNTADKRFKSRLTSGLTESAIQSAYNYLAVLILISTILSSLMYLKIGADFLHIFTGDVSSSYVEAGAKEELDRAMSPMLIATTGLSFAFLYSVFHQDAIKVRKIATKSLIVLIAFAINLLLAGSRGLTITVIVLLLLIFLKTSISSAVKIFYQLRLSVKNLFTIGLIVLMMAGGVYILFPRINSLISEISGLSSAIGFAFSVPYPSTVSSTSTRVDVIKELFVQISLMPQGFGAPLMANFYSNGPKYATEMQIINYLRMGGLILIPLFVIMLRHNKNYFPAPVSKVYSSYVDFMLVFSLTNPLFFNFQMFFSLVAFSFLVDSAFQKSQTSSPKAIN